MNNTREQLEQDILKALGRCSPGPSEIDEKCARKLSSFLSRARKKPRLNAKPIKTRCSERRQLLALHNAAAQIVKNPGGDILERLPSWGVDPLQIYGATGEILARTRSQPGEGSTIEEPDIVRCATVATVLREFYPGADISEAEASLLSKVMLQLDPGMKSQRRTIERMYRERPGLFGKVV